MNIQSNPPILHYGFIKPMAIFYQYYTGLTAQISKNLGTQVTAGLILPTLRIGVTIYYYVQVKLNNSMWL